MSQRNSVSKQVHQQALATMAGLTNALRSQVAEKNAAILVLRQEKARADQAKAKAEQDKAQAEAMYNRLLENNNRLLAEHQNAMNELVERERYLEQLIRDNPLLFILQVGACLRLVCLQQSTSSYPPLTLCFLLCSTCWCPTTSSQRES